MTLYLTDTTSDLTGGEDFNNILSLDIGTASSISVTVGNLATETSYFFTDIGALPSNDWDTGTIVIEVNVTTAVDIDLRLNASRVNSAGSVQETATQTALQSLNSTGVKTFTIASQNWTAGNCTDRLRLEFEFTSNNDHGGLLTTIFESNTTDSEVTITITPVATCGPSVEGLNTSGRGFLQFDNDHITTVAVAGTLPAAPNEPYLHFGISSLYKGDVLTPNVEVEETGTAFNDVATVTGASLIYNPNSPANRRSHTLVYDSTRDRFILFGGLDRDDDQYNDTWALSMNEGGTPSQPQWKQLSPTGTPPSVRRTHVAEFDSTANRMIVGLGFDGSDLSDWFELDFSGGEDGAWASLSITADPSPIADGDGIPDARAQASTAIDNANVKMYIFAGFGATRFNDLWELDLTDGSEQWTELAEDGKSGSPSQRNDPAFIYDSTNTQLVAFGGYTGSARLNDVWFWNIGGSAFVEQTGISGTPPSIRELAMSVYDDTNNRMIIYGGRNGTAASDVREDLFELDLTVSSEAWVDRTNTAGEVPAGGWSTNAGAYDSLNKIMVAQGGLDSSLEENRHALSFDLSGGGAINQRQLVFNNYIRGRDAMGYAWDEDNDVMLCWGGYARLNDGEHTADIFAGEHCNEAWLYHPATDTWFNPVNNVLEGPGNREGANAVYDTNRNRFIVWGGLTGNATSNNTFYNDTWELVADARGHYKWNKLAPSGSKPTARWLAAMIYDKTNDRCVLVGGDDGSSFLNDEYTLDFSGGADGAWATLSPTGSAPTAKRQPTFIYDETNSQMVISHGGTGVNSFTNEIHFLDLTDGAEAWSAPSVTGTPPSARRGMTGVYDNSNGYMIMFGGFNAGGALVDTFYLDLASGSEVWNEVIPASNPEARRSHISAYNRTTNKTYIYGGRDDPDDAQSFITRNNTWELDTDVATEADWEWTLKTPDIAVSVNLKVTGLSDTTDYHWQAWGVGNVTGTSAGTSFGGNAESAADFTTNGGVADLSINENENITISENVVITNIQLGDIVVNDSPTVTDVVVKVEFNSFINVNDAITISEDVSITETQPDLDINKGLILGVQITS